MVIDWEITQEEFPDENSYHIHLKHIPVFESPQIQSEKIAIHARPATKQESLAQLGEIIINPDNKSNCAICLCQINCNEKIRKLDCVHKYHIECLDTWFWEQIKRDLDLLCPLCQKTLFTLF